MKKSASIKSCFPLFKTKDLCFFSLSLYLLFGHVESGALISGDQENLYTVYVCTRIHTFPNIYSAENKQVDST